MVRIIPDWIQLFDTTSRRRSKRSPRVIDRRFRHCAFELLEERALLSVAQDLQNEIAPYQTAINTALSVATSLPLVGHQLESLQDLSTLLQNSLASIQAQTQNITSGHHQIVVMLPGISHTFTFDLGLNNFLQVSTSGGVTASISPVLNIGFDYQGTSATLDAADTNLDIGFSLSLPQFQATASLNGILYAHAADENTQFNGHLLFGFASDGSVSPQFSGDAHIRLGLSLSFVDPALNASFNPRFFTHLQIDWSINPQSNALMIPSIMLKNFSLDADSFLHGFMGDIVTTVQKFTKPLQPFIDMFDTPVPIISAFDSSETIGDLMFQGAGLSQGEQDRFNLMVHIIKSVNTFDLSASTGGAVINFGDISLTGDATVAKGFNFDTSQISNVIGQIFGTPALDKVKDALETVANYAGVDAQSGFQFPLLENPGPILGGILTGNPETMFSFSTGREHYELPASIGVGIKDLFGIFLSAGIVFDADLSMGYDSSGLIKFVQDPLKKPEDLLHGFYFDNSIDTSDLPVPNVSSPRKTALYLEGFAELSASAIVTLSGGLYANVSVELANTDNAPHVYLDTMIQNIGSNSKVFKLAGQVYASAQLELTFDAPVGPSITLFSYELGRDVLLDFDPPPPPTFNVPLVVIDVTNQHTLQLDVGKMSPGAAVTVQPFQDFTINSGGTFVGDGIRVDYPTEIDLYVERKNDLTTNYYNLIGVNGVVPQGMSINVIDPFRLFKDEGAPEPEPAQTTPAVILVGGKNVAYKYSETSDGSHAKVLLAGGYGSNTLTGGTMEFGNFIPAARIDQAKQHFGDTSGFDAAGVGLINSTIDAAVAPANPAGIIGATMTASHGGLMFGGPGNNSFIATGAGAYEMIGGMWVNTFNITPSFDDVPATYQIDGGPFGQSQLVVRVPAGENVTFENSTVVDKYNPSFKALAVEANAGLSATAHGIQKVHIVATSGSSVAIGDTSELNIDFSISGGAHLTFGGTNAPDSFDVSTSGPFYGMKNHFSVPKFAYYYYPPAFGGATVGPVPDIYGVLLPNRNSDPIYYVTRTFGTNGKTQTIPFAVSDADASSIGLDGKGAKDTYNLTLGVGAFIDVAVEDSDTTTQNDLTVNVRDRALFNNQVTLTDNALHLDYYTLVDYLDAIPLVTYGNPEYYAFSSSVHYTPSVMFGANENVTFASARAFTQTIVDRPTAPQAATILVDGLGTISPISPQSFGPIDQIFDETVATPQPIDVTALPPTFEVQANAGPLTLIYTSQAVRIPLTVDVHGNTGTLAVQVAQYFDATSPSFNYINTFNVLGNSGTLTIDNYLYAGTTNGLAHVVNVLGNTGTINIQDGKSSAVVNAIVPDVQVNIGTNNAGTLGSLANVHGTINLSSSHEVIGNFAILIDDRNGSGTPGNWTFDTTHTQIGDLAINGSGYQISGSGYSTYDTYWRSGTHVTLIDGPPIFNTKFNGSSSFPIDFVPPGDQTNFEQDTVNFSLANFRTPPSVSVTYAATNLPTGLMLNSTTGLIAGTIPLQTSLNSPFHVHYSVAGGNYTFQSNHDWIVNGTISISPEFDLPADVDEGTNFELDFFVNNSAPRPVTLSASGLPAWLSFGPTSFDPNLYSIVGIPPVGSSANGPYHIIVRGDDGVSATDLPFDLNVSGIKFAPLQPIRLNQIGETVNFGVAATTTSGRALTYSSGTLPAGISIDLNTGQISGTVAANAAPNLSYVVTVTATDGLTSRYTFFTWNVLALGVANSVQFASPGPQLNRVGDGIALQTAAQSSLFLHVQYSLAGLPDGFGITDTGYIFGTFGADAVANSPYHVTVIATDGRTSSQIAFDWTVMPVGPISVQNPGSITSVINSVVSRQIVASTTAGLPLSYSASGLPNGLSINSQTGAISGTISPLSALPGIFNTDVTVTDGTNTYGTMFQWIVNGNSQPSIVPLLIPGGGTITLTSPFHTQISASITTDPGVALPGGIQFPFGYLNFVITPVDKVLLIPGAVITLTISGPSFVQTDKYYKYGPTPANPTAHWYDFLFNQQTDGDSATGTGMQIVGGNLVLHLTDGGRGDDDLAKNGVIHDLGGPAKAVAQPQLPGDYNQDGQVDSSDYGLWRTTFGSASDHRADGNGNGVVDAADYTVWRDHLTASQTSPPALLGDYNRNGIVDAADYTLWRDKLAPASRLLPRRMAVAMGLSAKRTTTYGNPILARRSPEAERVPAYSRSWPWRRCRHRPTIPSSHRHPRR